MQADEMLYILTVPAICWPNSASLDGGNRPERLTTHTYTEGDYMATNILSLNIPKPELAKGESLIIRVFDEKVTQSNRVWLEVEDSKGGLVYGNTLDIELQFAAQ